MRFAIEQCSHRDVLPFRIRQQREMNCQIVHDSIHHRPGWAKTYRFELEGIALGFGSVAVAGPWENQPTVYDFYVQPSYRNSAFGIFETFINAIGVRFFEVQSSNTILSSMLHTYVQNIQTEKIVFQDQLCTNFILPNARLHCNLPIEAIQKSIESRKGGPELELIVESNTVGTGGILFHYNRPYCDIYMEIKENFRRQGFGAFLVQELKRMAYNLGCIPCARCNPNNTASYKTLGKAGFVPYAQVLSGSLPKELIK